MLSFQDLSNQKSTEIETLARIVSDLQEKVQQHEINAAHQTTMVDSLKEENLRLFAASATVCHMHIWNPSFLIKDTLKLEQAIKNCRI